MAIFKYTVANKEGHKLSGSIEAPSDATARNELNSLGFSILELKEDQEDQSTKELEAPKADGHTKFLFESINPQGQLITGTISATDDMSAFKRLTKEYELTVTAIWSEDATEEQISNARARGTFHLQEILSTEEENKRIEETKTNQSQRKNEIFVRTKVEEVLKQVNELLTEYQEYILPEQKKQIDKRIDKLLRIKNSTNLDYIITTAEDLIKFIQTQEAELKKKGHLEKRAKLKFQIKNMLSRLHETGKSKSLSEDIVKNIQDWQKGHVQKTSKLPWYTRTINKILIKIERIFEVPEEIRLLKSQIKTYNSQIIEYVKIYFKEPTKDYKAKAWEAIKTIWKTRKKTVQKLKETKKRIKQEKHLQKSQDGTYKLREEFGSHLLNELTEFTGWLLAFYLIYYFVSLYITSKNFGLGDPLNFPKSLNFYNTQIFKYALVTIFLAHIALTLKVNFFQKIKIASYVLFPITTFAIIFIFVNF